MASTITISQQPANTTFNLKSYTEDVAAASFSVLASAVSSVGGGVVPVTYQWQRSTNSGSTYSNINGATSNALNFDAPVTATGYYYRAVVSAQDASNVNSTGAILTVNNQFAPYATNTEAGSARYQRLHAIEAV